MFTIESNFVGNFKVGDNINHNLRILRLLYKYLDGAETSDKQLLLKPITVILVSIIEAFLYDFHYRARNFNREGIRNISADVLDYIRGKDFDELEKYIASAKKHSLFGSEDETFYLELDEMRKLRNRVHIQNSKNHFESDECDVFNEDRKSRAEKALEKVMRVMSEKYKREEHHHHVEDFVLPWSAHL